MDASRSAECRTWAKRIHRAEAAFLLSIVGGERATLEGDGALCYSPDVDLGRDLSPPLDVQLLPHQVVVGEPVPVFAPPSGFKPGVEVSSASLTDNTFLIGFTITSLIYIILYIITTFIHLLNCTLTDYFHILLASQPIYKV